MLRSRYTTFTVVSLSMEPVIELQKATSLVRWDLLPIPNHLLVVHVSENGLEEDLPHNLPRSLGSLYFPRFSFPSWRQVQYIPFSSHQKTPLVIMTFKDDRVRSCSGISQLLQHSWVHPVWSHRLAHVWVVQTLNFVFLSCGSCFTLTDSASRLGELEC